MNNESWIELQRIWEQQQNPANQRSVVRWNRLADQEHALAFEVLTDSALVTMLRERIADDDTSPDEAERLINLFILDTSEALEEPEEFRNHPLVALNAHQLPLEPSVVLIEQSEQDMGQEQVIRPEEGRNLSQSGGQPTWGEADWPTEPSGHPLEFVMQVDLSSAALNLGFDGLTLQQTGLPTSGLLQLFADLSTDVRETHAANAGVVVRLISDRQLERLVVDTRHEAAFPHARLVTEMAASPGYPDANLSEEELGRFLFVEESLEVAARMGLDDSVALESVATPGHAPVLASSRLRGLGHHVINEQVTASLNSALPLTDEDRHVILLDVAGNRNLEGAFGDCGHLQVWIRASDLSKRNFSDIAAMCRTD